MIEGFGLSAPQSATSICNHAYPPILAFFWGSVMGSDKSVRRMTLRQLLTHSEKCARDLVDLVHTGFLGKIGDFRDLSRPVRRRSHYPTMIALQNSLKKVLETVQQTQELADFLNEHMEAIRDHANRERVNRL
jgi:hypothetical protein